jgi:hypothetical protein
MIHRGAVDMKHDDKERAVYVLKGFGRFTLQTAVASAIMSVSQYVEMGLTHRAPSDLPIRLVEVIAKREASPGFQRETAVELGQGTLAAIALATANVRAAGLGGMPWTWSRRELVIDLTHKTVLSMATRAIVERER